MNQRVYALFGILGPLLVYVTIAISLAVSPWFSWQTNALSDLGHSVNSSAAPIFNFGLLISGFLLIIYSLTVFKKYAKYSSYFLLVSTFFVQLISVFNETYGSIHYAVAVPHFLMLSATSIVYSVEKRSVLAAGTFLAVMFCWLLYALNLFGIGIAVPETVSKLVLLWIMYSAVQIFSKKDFFSRL